MSNEKIEIKLSDNQKELIIRQGIAEPIHEQKAYTYIEMLITSPADWFEKRVNNIQVNPMDCHVVADYKDRSILLVLNERDKTVDKIGGMLIINEELEKLCINKGPVSIRTLAKTLKMKRHLFADKEDCMRLVSELLSFRAKIEKEVEKFDDRRGNKRDLTAHVVNSNLPKGFTLNLPIFEGMEKFTINIEIEIDVNDTDTTVTLISPDLEELIITQTDLVFEKELSRFVNGVTIIKQ
jgi:hypothetical protein